MAKRLLILLFILLSGFIHAQSFTSIWNTNNTSANSPANDQITIPTNPAYISYDYTVEWGDGAIDNNVTGDITHTYADPDTYTISISGDFPAIYFNNVNTGDKLKIIEITDWGTIQWQTMENAFHGCENLNFDAIASPDLSQVTSLSEMFRDCTSFNGIVNNWDISTITDISGMFYDASIFNRPLNGWTTNAITDMSQTFREAKLFNEPLDSWITSNVTNMSELFYEAVNFNQDIGNWNVSQVTDMSGLFFDTDFNHPLNLWRVDNVTNMSEMFMRARDFNQDINIWVVDNVTDMSEMFHSSGFNNPLDNWNVDNVENMAGMFGANRVFNQPLNGWIVTKVTNMSYMFGGGGNLKTVFNQPLDLWIVGNVTDMSRMFSTSSFNQPLDMWDVSGVENMSGMFGGSTQFNSDFDQPLPTWEVGEVTNMSSMFQRSVFNQDIGMWDVDKVTSMSSMFAFSQNFNQVLSGWNTENVSQMTSMFSGAVAFDQNLGGWDISGVSNMGNMLANAALSQENYDNTLIGWAAQAVNSNVSLGATGVQYCDGLVARQELIDTYNWNITGDVVNCTNVFCTTITSPIAGDTNVPANSSISWEPTPNATGYLVSLSRENGGSTQVLFDEEDFGNIVQLNFTNEFTPGDNVEVTVIPYNAEGPAVGCTSLSFTVVPSWVNSPAAYKLEIDTRLPGFGSTPANQFEMEINTDFTYDYSIDWGDGEYDNNVSSNIIHTYLIPGVYTIAVIGDYPAPFFGTFGDGEKVTSIEQWGTYEYLSMHRACKDCENMVYNATDIPDLSQVTDMSEMFIGASLFNADINAWDVSNVTNMQELFSRATAFNQPLDTWVMDNVTNMSGMFNSARAFNQPLTTFETGNATNMANMFRGASVFDQELNGWDVSKVTNMAGMLSYMGAFNQPLDRWTVNNVTNMREMFKRSVVFNQPLDAWIVEEVTDMAGMFDGFYLDMAFNQPLNSWNVDKVTNMQAMFQQCIFFNQPLNSWKTGLVEDMSQMFQEATVFNQDIDSWNVTNVLNMTSMFEGAANFNGPLTSWDVNSVVNMTSMFKDASAFNQPIDAWEVSAVANMTSMFEDAVLFDQPLNLWDVSSVTIMPSMFEGATVFNGTMSNWNVASVTNMQSMFEDAAAFDQAIPNWDTGAVLTMQEMFKGAAAFNQDIDAWDVSYVTTMESMFELATNYNQSMNSWNVASVNSMGEMFKTASSFNGAIDGWNVRGVTTMEEMFNEATSFDQNLNDWRIAGVSNMDSMFESASSYNQAMNLWNLGSVSMNATFNNATALNQYLGDWDISSVSDMTDMLDNTALTRENYDNTLIAWSEQTLTSGITLGAEGLPYCDAQEERQSMIDNFGWTFSLDVRDCPIPLCTQLSSPMNGTVDVPVNTNITWEAVQFAQGYRLTVGTTPGGNNIEDNRPITNETSYEFPNDFNTGDIVYVTLIPFNDEGDAVGPCTEESFTISSDPATIPDCTSLTDPLNDANDVLVSSDLSWSPISNADGYRLTVGTTSGANDILDAEDVGNMITHDFTTDLPEDSDIYVTIIPYNDEGDATGCTEERFNTELIPVPPVCTNLISPANTDTDVAIDTNLSWTAVSNATGYLVVVGTTSGGIEVVNNIDVGNTTTFDIPVDLQESRLYYVTIIPYNTEGDAIGCTEETFRTGDSTSPPSCVLLSAPANGATAVPLDTNLTWNGSSSADGYRLTVGTTPSGTDIFTGDLSDVTIHDLATDLPESTMIYVSITAYNINGDSTGCTEESFMTDGPPLCTTLIAPANLETNVAVDVPSISWNPSANADGYQLTITASSSTANNETDLNITSGTTHNFTNDFERGETVTVTIVPYNGTGNAAGPCTSETFTIIPPPVPLCTSLITPANGAIDIAVDTDLEWNPSAGADGYRLTVLASSSTTNNVTDFDIPTGSTYNVTNDFEQGETVTVTIVPYNIVGDAIGCTSETFTIKTVPNCTSLITPIDGAVDITVDTSIEWTPIAAATGYRLTVLGSSSTANNETNLDIPSGTTHNFANDFEQGETVSITITPYNEVGDALGCTVESFTIAAVPVCTNLTMPLSNAIDVAVDTDIQWQAIAEATGYRLTANASSTTTNTITDLDITGTSYVFPADFEQGEIVTVTIVPYNTTGAAIGCTSESFTIKSVPLCTYLIAPANGEVVAEASEITWNSFVDADGYQLTINASNSTANDIADLDVTGTKYTFPTNFDEGELVTVTITPYNEVGDAIGCTSESFTIRPVPPCTSLLQPLNNTTAVSVSTDISWNASADADGYRISVGTTPNGTDIVNNEDVASLTNYILADDLPSETMIYVTVVPYNTSGDAIGCTSESFETEIIAPDCAVMTSPANGETDVSLESRIRWDAIEKTDGYRISIGTTASGTDIVANLDMGSETNYTHREEFPFGTEIFVSIIPYNAAGNAIGCEQQSFTTLTPEDETKYGFSPNGDGINDFWQIENIAYYPENVVSIYNRWGDMVFVINDYDNQSNVFSGTANQKTKMGGGELPSGTYFFNIQIDGETILRKTQGYLVLKR